MISVLCPTLNEEKHIEQVLKHFIGSLPKEKELLIIDGGSKDATREIVKMWTDKYLNIHLLENPKKYVSYALNIGIKNSQSNLIVRIDAHSLYELDYYEKIVETFDSTGADIVGGPMRVLGKTYFQKAVAYCTSCSFGIGDSKIHNIGYRGETDHVYLGSWKRNLFDEIGFFDEQLVRNQDDEFHYRAKSFGKLIYLNPEIKSYYFPRSNLSKLFIQYFQYGLFKPLVLWKIKSGLKIRHLVPSLFVMYLVILLFMSRTFFWLPLAAYLILLLGFSLINKEKSQVKLLSLVVFPALHIAYGIGFISGFGNLIHKKT